jgi:hypothetical protein
MRITRHVTVAAMTGLLFATSVGTAQADDHESRPDRNNPTGFAVFSITNGEADSLLEIDRTLDFNDGSGSAGSDNEWHGVPEAPDED